MKKTKFNIRKNLILVVQPLKGGKKIMKKVMWLGLSIEITVLIIMLLFVVFKKPVPGVLVGIFVAGMLTSIISSFFVQREKIKEN